MGRAAVLRGRFWRETLIGVPASDLVGVVVVIKCPSCKGKKTVKSVRVPHEKIACYSCDGRGTVQHEATIDELRTWFQPWTTIRKETT